MRVYCCEKSRVMIPSPIAAVTIPNEKRIGVGVVYLALATAPLTSTPHAADSSSTPLDRRRDAATMACFSAGHARGSMAADATARAMLLPAALPVVPASADSRGTPQIS